MSIFSLAIIPEFVLCEINRRSNVDCDKFKHFILIRNLGRCENKVGGRNETHIMDGNGGEKPQRFVYARKSLLITRKTRGLVGPSTPRSEQRSFAFAEQAPERTRPDERA